MTNANSSPSHLSVDICAQRSDCDRGAAGVEALAYSALLGLLERCWAQDPNVRPGFHQVLRELKALQVNLIRGKVRGLGARADIK